MSDISAKYKDPVWLRSEMFVDGRGIHRWKSNRQVPPSEIIALLDLSHEQVTAHNEARAQDFDAFAVEYRRMRSQRTPEQIAEERAEARAAHGPGVKLVNILTGETYTT